MPAHGEPLNVSKKASAAIAGYRFVMLVAAGLATANGPRANIVGATGLNGADEDAMCDYAIPGQAVVLVESGGTFAAGDPLTSGSDGRAVKAMKGDRIGGYASEESTSAGELVGVILALSGTKGAASVKALPAFVAADTGPLAADVVDGAIFTVPQTAANSTVTLPNPAAPNALDDGIEIRFFADGELNDHTVTYRDGDGNVVLTAAATLGKRHAARALKVGGKWHVDLSVQA